MQQVADRRVQKLWMFWKKENFKQCVIFKEIIDISCWPWKFILKNEEKVQLHISTLHN